MRSDHPPYPEDEQQGKIGAFFDQNGAREVIHASAPQGPDEKKCAPAYAVAPLQRSHRWGQHDQGIDCGKRNYDDREAYTTQADRAMTVTTAPNRSQVPFINR